jgi:hypothetical protein
VKEVMISLPLLVAFTSISRKGTIQMTANKINTIYKIPFLMVFAIF